MPNLDVAVIELEADQNRAALKLLACEIHRRLRRDYLIDLAIGEIAGDAATIGREVVDQVKENGGKAALFGAGLLLAFGAGRGTSAVPSERTNSASVDEPSRPAERAVGLSSAWKTVLSWAGGIGGATLGYTISNSVPVSAAERELLGDAPSELKALGDEFVGEHLAGAKQVLADSFGAATFAAGALGLMAAFAKIANPVRAG